MARTQRQPFSPTGDYVALRDFRFAGKSYKRNEPFPWRKLSCSTRKLLQLWEGRYIDIKGSDLPEEELEEEAVDTDENLVDTEEADESSDEAEEEIEEEAEEAEAEDEAEDGADEETADMDAFTFDPELHRVVKSKKNGLCIKQGKKFIMKIDKKLAKQLQAATEPVEIELG